MRNIFLILRLLFLEIAVKSYLYLLRKYKRFDPTNPVAPTIKIDNFLDKSFF